MQEIFQFTQIHVHTYMYMQTTSTYNIILSNGKGYVLCLPAWVAH